MIKRSLIAVAITSGMALSGCANLAPDLPRANANIPLQWGETPFSKSSEKENEGWENTFTDPELVGYINSALANNKDIRIALLNVKKARAQYRIEDANKLPEISASGEFNRGKRASKSTDQWSALGMASYEIDLFNRVGNLSEKALNQYRAEENQEKVMRLTVISEVANSYLHLKANDARHRLAISTLSNRESSLNLTKKRYDLGAVSELDFLQEKAIVGTAKADVEHYAGQLEKNINALSFLVGKQISRESIKKGNPLKHDVIYLEPKNLESSVLLSRPDIMKAEDIMKAANANIGAARAAMFPSIRLTSSLGTSSSDIDGLFNSGSGLWQFGPQVNIPIFNAGSLKARVKIAKAEQDIALAKYEKSIEQGFREVADSLALLDTIKRKKKYEEEIVDSYKKAHSISKSRYDAGQDSYIVLLDTERSLYSSQQQLINTIAEEQFNKIELFKALGGNI